MKEYLKMADMFDAVSDNEFEAELNHDIKNGLICNDDIKYIIHAVKYHDSLVAENESLRDQLKRCADELSWMIDNHNEQSMSDGSWKYDYQTPFDAHKLLDEVDKCQN